MLRKELKEKMRTEKLMRYFKDTRGWGEEADRWLKGSGIKFNINKPFSPLRIV